MTVVRRLSQAGIPTRLSGLRKEKHPSSSGNIQPTQSWLIGQTPPCIPWQPAQRFSSDAGRAGSAPTANVESCWTMSELPHSRQVTAAARSKTRCSNRALQLLHSYSYRGKFLSLHFVAQSCLRFDVINDEVGFEGPSACFGRFAGMMSENSTEHAKIAPTMLSEISMLIG